MSDLQPHGTRACWRRGCRQPECVDANREFERARYARRETDFVGTLVKPEPWMSEGACVGADPEVFFIERGESAAPAKAICAACPVRQECLAYALDNAERFGVWGGKSERERRGLRRARQTWGAA
jgi:WhiB family redox-sensing transcriptional regulator